MKFEIVMGVPEMQEFWEDLRQKAEASRLGNEAKLFKRLVKTLNFLRNDPKHTGLKTHEIKALTRRYGRKVWQSYLESKTPSAGRVFWVYGPNKGQITIIGIEPHPEDKKRGGYNKVRLSHLPEGN
jgi:hypothetical protein